MSGHSMNGSATYRAQEQVNLLQATTYWDLLQQRAELTPDAPMLVVPSGQRLSFAQYQAAAERLAAALFEQGIRFGSKVTWQFPTGLQAAVLLAALARLGAVQNPIIHLYREHEVRSVLQQSGSQFFIVPARFDDRDLNAMAQSMVSEISPSPKVIVFDQGWPEAEPISLPNPSQDASEPRWVFYTSGTTAEPKGAMHADLSLISAGRGLAQSYGLTSADVGAMAFPIAHVGGPMYLTELLASGASALLLERFVPAQAVELFRRYGVTACGGSTAHYLAFLAEQARQPLERLIPSLRVLGGGGAPKPPDLYFRAKRELGVTICHTYGMTECPCITMIPNDSLDEQLAFTEGVPQADIEVRIVLRDGTLATPGIEGEICLRGSGMFKRYTDAALNQAAFDDEGYFRTGDVGLLRADGRLVLTGRIKDIIIRKGENISAREIEDLLQAHPKVEAVAVIGLPDESRGERVCAVVELRAGCGPLTFEEMVSYFEGLGLMRQKIPEQLEIMARLPRNETLNKIQKNTLRERFGAVTQWL